MKLLLIMPEFYDLTKAIADCLNKSFEVTYFRGDFNLNFFDKFLLNFSSKFIENKFLKKIKESLLDKYESDYFNKIIIIFAGEIYWTKNIVSCIKSKFNHAEMIYYAWDNMHNIKHGSDFINLFDKTFSYDMNDCKKYKMTFLPIFYHLKYPTNYKEYDCTTVVSFYLDKEKNLRIINSCLSKNIKKLFYLYIPNKFLYFYYRLIFHKLMRGYRMSDFKFEKISGFECSNLFSKGFAIADIPLECNSGITSRVINALYNNKKIITTNKDIEHYSFYNKNNIYIVDECSGIIPDDFFNTPFDEKYKPDQNFSIENFCSVLVGLNNLDYNAYYK